MVGCHCRSHRLYLPRTRFAAIEIYTCITTCAYTSFHSIREQLFDFYGGGEAGGVYEQKSRTEFCPKNI